MSLVFPAVNILQASPLLRFRAKAMPQPPQRILSIAALKQQIVDSGTPYIQGVADRSLGRLSSERQQQLLKTLDALAEKLSQIDFSVVSTLGRVLPRKHLPAFRIRLGPWVIPVQHVGSGTFGSVFKLTVDGHKLAFKTFFKRHRELYYSGPYSETALGLYATQKQVSNMPRLIAANPARNWLMSEFVDQDFRPANPKGPRWQDLDLKAFDADEPENECRTREGCMIRLDYGAITGPQRPEETLHPRLQELFGFPPGPPPMLSLKQFKHALKTASPEKRLYIMDNLGLVPEPDRPAALKVGLGYPELHDFPLPMFLQKGILKPAHLTQLASWLTQHPSVSVRNLIAYLGLDTQDSCHALPLKIAAGEYVHFQQWLSGIPGILP